VSKGHSQHVCTVRDSPWSVLLQQLDTHQFYGQRRGSEGVTRHRETTYFIGALLCSLFNFLLILVLGKPGFCVWGSCSWVAVHSFQSVDCLFTCKRLCSACFVCQRSLQAWPLQGRPTRCTI